jgi:uncharacterized SAM-binding protein YcdF (DUF218 family)
VAVQIWRHKIGVAVMFNLASKVFFLFVDPPALIFLLLICAWILRKRLSRAAVSMYATAILLLFVLGCPTISQWLVRSLEDQYPDKGMAVESNAQAIIVLGGALNLPSDAHPFIGIVSSADRIEEGLRLYRAGKAPLIVASGGDSPLNVKARTLHEADEMRSLLEEWGVPDSAIIVEDASINTRENALFTRRLLSARGIDHVILVTSALHMPRAVATFRKVGFDVAAAPADFQSGWVEQVAIFNWLPSSGDLANSSSVIREWLGYFIYWLRGWV